ncbi:MAG: nucleoside hydrolase, partial [Erysipelotrichaceae bacterium]|nr:nucleoside hydrolase [Erysipelotrichaceae bacterium]
MNRKIIIDVDTGIDDALAIIYLLGQQDAELIGITTCFGNNTLANTTENTLRLLHLMKRDDIRVYPGAAAPLERRAWPVSPHLHRIHGYNGLGNVELEPSPNKASRKKAWDYLIDSCRKYGKDLDLVFVGPLTNLCRAYEKDPEALKMANGITVMGGALTIAGNVTPEAEANLYNDVKAAKIIFDSDLKVNLIGLDVTLKTRIDDKDM